MTAPHPAPDDPGGDLEYDLAHDAADPQATSDALLSSGTAAVPPAAAGPPAGSDDGGDLSYDLAHDVPR